MRKFFVMMVLFLAASGAQAADYFGASVGAAAVDHVSGYGGGNINLQAQSLLYGRDGLEAAYTHIGGDASGAVVSIMGVRSVPVGGGVSVFAEGGAAYLRVNRGGGFGLALGAGAQIENEKLLFRLFISQNTSLGSTATGATLTGAMLAVKF